MTAAVPTISVVMPVHDARPYLERSVASILDQTVRDLELVIVENGSTDGSAELLRSLAASDPRIRLFHAPDPLGRAGSSNRVVSHARAPLVARMDADDVSHPRRLERQLEVLARHCDAVMVGSLYEGIDGAGRRVRPRDRSRLRRRGGIESPFPHGSVTFRREAFNTVGGYRSECEGWEDLDLFQRLARVGRVLVLPCVLYTVRFRPGSAHAGMPVERFVRVAVAKDRVIRHRFPSPEAGLSRRDPTLDALYEHSASRLWAGGRPELLIEVVARGVAGHRARRARLLAWAAWGRVSPGSLRRALHLATSMRDLAAGRHVPDGQPVEWRYG